MKKLILFAVCLVLACSTPPKPVKEKPPVKKVNKWANQHNECWWDCVMEGRDINYCSCTCEQRFCVKEK